ncbi:MAG: PAS domain S-box protein [Chitinivorax sp.]
MINASSDPESDRLWGYLGRSLVLAVFLAVATLFGSVFAAGLAGVSLLWLVSGVATAGLLLLGPAYWPTVALAAFFSGMACGMSAQQAWLLALGSAIGALLSVTAMRRLVANVRALESLRDLFYLTSIGALCNSMVLATFATLAAHLAGNPAGLSLHRIWLLWWAAGINGILLVVPLVLSLAKRRTAQHVHANWPELLLLLLVTALTGAAVFGNPGLASGKPNLSLQLAIFPLIVWGAVRFGYLGTASVAMLVTITATTALLFGPASATTLPFETTLFLMAFMAVMVLAGLTLCATLEEKQLAMEVLQDRRQQTQTVLDNLPTLFYIRDLNGRYLLGNRAFADLLGMQAHELVGLSAAQLFDRAEARRLDENDRAVAQTGRNIQFEEHFVAQGRSCVFLTNKFPLHDRTGKLIGICANGIDITSRKRAEADLSAAEAKFRALVESSLAGIFIVQNGIVMYANPELARLLGYSQQELIGRRLESLLWLDDRERLMHDLSDLAHRQGETELFAFRLMHRAGYPIEVEMHSRRLIYDGQVAMFGLILDIRERLRTERQLQLYAKVFENANDAICIVDGADRVVAVNEAFCRISGYQQAEVSGKAIGFIQQGFSEALLQTIRKQLLLCGHWQGEFVGRTRTGGEYPAWLSVSALRDSNGAIVNSVAVISDITAVKRAEREKLYAESKFRALVELSLVGLYIVQDGRIVYANPTLATMLGYSQQQLVGMALQDITAADDVALVQAKQLLHLRGETHGCRYQYRARRRDGKLLDVEAHGRVFEYDGRAAVIGLLMDVSENLARERQLKLAAKVFDNASEGILITDADAQIIAVNPAFCKITGYPAVDALGKVSRMFKSGIDSSEFNSDMLMSLEVNGHWQGELTDRRAGGELYPAWLSISAVREESGSISNYVAVFSDITGRKEAEERLYFLANHDPLTLLPNRSLLHQNLGHALARANVSNQQLAVLFIDLDRFKTINDTLGHDAGDKLLQEVSARLRACARSSDTIARLGGDEFTVIMEGIGDATVITGVAERILAALAQPVLLQAREYYVTCSIGIATYPGDGADAQALLKNADVAMYRAKDLGKNNYQFFAKDMSAAAFEHLLMENSLRQALERSEFELHYQAQVELEQNRIIGLEALVRWNHPEHGLISPTRFIPLAEENGMIVPLGEWVLEQACCQARRWQQLGFPPVRVAVNLSPRQFQPHSLVRAVRQALESSGLDPQWLELEITEGMIMRNAEEAIQIMSELKQMGVQLAIDDFGTGYSSLYNLKRFPIHNLKIDRSFVEGLPKDGDDAAIAEVIIAMAKKLGLRVIAEGVENSDQLAFLRDQGCDLVQGFMFSKPLPECEVEALFHDLGIHQDEYQAALPLAVRPNHVETV